MIAWVLGEPKNLGFVVVVKSSNGGNYKNICCVRMSKRW
jgi:hypothetical protein